MFLKYRQLYRDPVDICRILFIEPYEEEQDA